jgi:hypothetical protein
MSNRGLWILGLVFLAIWLGIQWLPRKTVMDTEGAGSAVAKTADGTPVVVTLLQREISEIVVEGGSSRSIPTIKSITWYQPVLVANDARTGALRWQRELTRIDDYNRKEQTRLLGADGDRVWIFADGIAGIDAATGQTVVDAAALETANPALRGVVPTDGKWFAMDVPTGKLVVTAADGRLWKVDASPLALTPTVKDMRQVAQTDDYLRWLQRWSAGPALGAQWNDYTLQGDLLETQWVGLLAPEERERFEGSLSQPQRPIENPPRRRKLWYGPVTSDKGITGTTWTLKGLAPAPESAEFLQGGLVRDGGRLGILRLKNPDGFLVIHTDRLGDDGQYLLTRVDSGGKPVWTAALPLRWIRDLVPGGDALVLLGPDRTAQYQGDGHGLLVTLDLASGRCRTWDYVTGAALETTCAPAG